MRPGEREARLRLLAEMEVTHQYSGPGDIHFDESQLCEDLRWLFARVERMEKALREWISDETQKRGTCVCGLGPKQCRVERTLAALADEEAK